MRGRAGQAQQHVPPLHPLTSSEAPLVPTSNNFMPMLYLHLFILKPVIKEAQRQCPPPH